MKQPKDQLYDTAIRRCANYSQTTCLYLMQISLQCHSLSTLFKNSLAVFQFHLILPSFLNIQLFTRFRFILTSTDLTFLCQKVKIIYLLLNRFIVITLQQTLFLACQVNMTKLETTFNMENATHNLLSKLEFSSMLYVELNSLLWLTICDGIISIYI